MAFFEPSSRFIAAIAPKHGALNRLKMQNAYAESGVKNENAEEEKSDETASEFSASPAIMFMLETTCSLATRP